VDLFIDGPEGPLEARLETPEGDDPPRAAAVVCHPHPEHGGTLETAVVHRTARGLLEAGVAALRFNFRSVGESTGHHSGERGPGGEEDDVLAAIDFLGSRFPGVDLWAAGFSFGARTVAAAVQRAPLGSRVILIALPVLVLPCDAVATLRLPGLSVQAGADEFGNRAALEERFPELFDGIERVEIAGADHLFRGRTKELQELVRRTASAWLAGGD